MNTFSEKEDPCAQASPLKGRTIHLPLQSLGLSGPFTVTLPLVYGIVKEKPRS